MAGFYWVDDSRRAYVARVYGVQGPRGGRVVLWEACCDGRRVACVTTRRDAIAALDSALNPEPAPVIELVNTGVDAMARAYRKAPEMVSPLDAESSMARFGFAALDTGNNICMNETGRVTVRLGACFYPLFTTRPDAAMAAVQRRVLMLWGAGQ